MMKDDLVHAIAGLKENEAMEMVQQRLNKGDIPLGIIDETGRAMEIVGKKFEASEYFIPDLIYAGEIVKNITQLVKPYLEDDTGIRYVDEVIIGTVAGDIHDIGKNIAAFMLEVNGFRVHDLGVDTVPGKFVEKIKETNARIVGLSGLLTLSFEAMKEVVEVIGAAGLRDKVHIMIGGGQVNEKVREYTGADIYCASAAAGVSTAKKWTGGSL
jgi:methanogenic corrinoid protein MtbC1